MKPARTPLQRARRAFEAAVYTRDAYFSSCRDAQARVDATYWDLYHLAGWGTPVKGKPKTYRRPAHIRAAVKAAAKALSSTKTDK